MMTYKNKTATEFDTIVIGVIQLRKLKSVKPNTNQKKTVKSYSKITLEVEDKIYNLTIGRKLNASERQNRDRMLLFAIILSILYGPISFYLLMGCQINTWFFQQV